MAVDRYQNSTAYEHPQESNLLNIHKVMQYNNVGQPVARVHVDGISLEGDVIVDTVSLSSSTLAALETVTISNTSFAVTNFPTTSTVYQGTIPWATTITNWPALQYVNGTLYAVQSGTWSVGVTGTVSVSNFTSTVNVASLPAISGTIAVSSLPAITGTVVASNFTSTVQVSNTVTIQDGGGSITVDGTVNAVVTQSTGTVNLVKYINTPNNLQMDMTQRLRVSPPTQSWWYAPTVDKDGDLRYIESATGTNAGSVFVQNLSSINMSSGTDSNGSFIRISRRRHKMRPGASMSSAFSVNWNGFVPDGNVTKRVGVFTNFNGVFYEMTSDLSVVIRRRLTDGTLVEKRVAREDFNIDPLDGTGETGYDLRPVVLNTANITAYVSKTAVPITSDGTVYRVVFTVSDPSQFWVSQKGRITGVSPSLYNGTVMVTAISGNNVTFVYNVDPGSFTSLSSAKFDHTAFHKQYTFGFDFNGNRATSVRFFMDGPLGRVAIHQEDFGGELSTPFANAPAISTRYEIFNSGAPGRLPNFTCSSEVINVEAELELNPGFGVATNNTPVVYSKLGTATYPVLGLALRAGEPYQRADLQLQAITFADIANINQQNAGVFYWRLVLNPTIGGTVPASSNIGKATRMWAYTAATTVSGGTDLVSGYASSTQQFDVRTALNFINIGSNIAYDDSDKIVLVVQQLVGGTSDAQLVATINFIEAL